MTPLVVVGSGMLGLAIGSFLNVVIHRAPLHQSIVTPGSRCPACRTPLRGRDNVPVASWVVLRGRCRYCAHPIPARYPLVEMGTAALFVALALRFGASWVLPAYAMGFASLLALSVIDLDHGLRPARIAYPALALTGALLLVAASAEDRWDDLRHAVAGGIAVAALLGVLRLVRPQGADAGDVPLALLVGAPLGFLGVAHVVVGVVAGAVLRVAVGAALRTTARGDDREPVAYGPFLALGALVTVLVGAAP